jgi:hypothetical protein
LGQAAEPRLNGERHLRIGERVALETLETVLRPGGARVEAGAEILEQVARRRGGSGRGRGWGETEVKGRAEVEAEAERQK